MLKNLFRIVVLVLIISLPARLLAQENELYIITGAHQDIGFGYGYQESMDEYAEQLKAHIELIELNPEIRFSMGNTYNTKDFLQRYPQYKQRLKRLMAEGKISTPAQWVGGEVDWYSGEFLVRTVAYSKYWAMSALEHEPHWMQINDTPSLTPQLAQILAKSEVYLLQAGKPSALRYILKEGKPWHFLGLDGSRTIIYAINYDDALNFSDFDAWDEKERSHWARQWAGRFNDLRVNLSPAMGDRGTEAERSLRIKKFSRLWNKQHAKQYGFRITMKTEEDYAQYLKKAVMEKKVPLPETTGTIEPWIWAGEAWQQQTMYHHSLVENRLPTVEKLASINELLGLAGYPSQQINRAWEEILWFPDHNWGNKDVDKARAKSNKAAYELTEQLLQVHLEKLAGAVNYKGEGRPLLVFNPLNWQRTECVRVALKTAPQGKWAVLDAQGRAVPAQLLPPENKTGQACLLFQAEGVPGMGYKSFYLADKLAAAPQIKSDLATGDDFIENTFYKVTMASDGSIKSIYDKQARRELVDNSQEHKFGSMNVYIMKEFKLSGKLSEHFTPTSFKLIESGPARVSLQVCGHVLNPRLPVSITIRLSAYAPRVEHEIQMDTGPREGKFGGIGFYYLALFKDLADKIQVGIPYGSIPRMPSHNRNQDISFSRRSPQRGFLIGPAEDKDVQKWMSFGNDAYSADLAFDNIQTRTYFKGKNFTATHLVGWYSGKALKWRFLIRGHKGNWQDNDSPRLGWEASNPLLAVAGQRKAGKLPEELSFITISTPQNPGGNNIILSVFKKAFAGRGYVARFYESEDVDTQVALQVSPLLNLPRAEVSRTNLMEKPFEVLTPKNGRYFIPTLGYGIESVGFFPQVMTDVINPAAVSDLKAGSPTSTSIRLSWTASGDDKQKGRASGYELRYSLRPIKENNWQKAKPIKNRLVPQAAGKKESFAATDLVPGKKYYFALKVKDEAGNVSPLSNVAAAQTEAPDTSAPAAVADLKVSKVSATTLFLQWTASGDDGQQGQAAKYQIGYAPEPITEENWDSVTKLAQPPLPPPAGKPVRATVFGLKPSTKYHFALKSVDEYGNISSLSNLVSQNTSALKVIRLQNGVSPSSRYQGCRDTHISGVNEEEAIMNYGDSAFTRNWAGGVRAVLIKFDLVPIPAGTTIHKAVLKLYAYDITYGDAGKAAAYRLIQDWDEEECNWSKAAQRRPWFKKGGAIDLTLIAKAPVADGGAWTELDITSLVQDWLNAKSPNYGLLIKGNCQEDCGIYYRSAEFKQDKNLRPVLEVSY